MIAFLHFWYEKGDSLITGGVKTVWPFYESSFHISVHNCPLWTMLVSCDEFIGHDSVKKKKGVIVSCDLIELYIMLSYN